MTLAETLGSADSGEEILALHRVGIHGLVARGPVGWADLIRMGLHVLEGLQDTQGFIHAATDGEVVDRAVHDHSIRIDDEQASEGNARLLVENAVGPGDLLLEVGNEGVGDISQAASLAIGLHPGQMAELAVHGDPENLRVATGEIAVTVTEGGDFRGADESEIERIEEEHHVFAAIVRQGDFFELLVHHGGGGEVWGRQTNKPGHGYGSEKG